MMFIDACYRKPTPRPPVWIMRQAGRYLPEYREIRAKHSFLEMCGQPEVVREVTLQPIRRFDMDAAIIFSDILLPLTPMGLQLRFAQGEGPVIDNPITTEADVAALRDPDFSKEMDFLAEALKITRAELSKDKALLGFCGAPFTLACYAIQGHGGGNFDYVRRWIYSNQATFRALMKKFTLMTVEYLKMQVAAGANAVQIFDSWGGALSAYDYLQFVFPYVKKIIERTSMLGVPRILFVKNASHFRSFLRTSEAEVIGLDWTMPMEESRNILGEDYAIQGNLDPMILFADKDYVVRRTKAMLEVNYGKPGYIANLGHGIHKETPIEHVAAFVETVKTFDHATGPDF
ncbi:uroporphyrinogen decarboxylase [Sulfidibacter corallicola]|uniref:Uroporphyrinogen decarboxylase n=1 Tax=Sulfidibacter corallicola TaxID=2818388 RepID=A0A8A4TXZ3_SULCO|nr:uroporphyrinogen decarboxylase [Sulfidibacter corallicola]QTD54078.1 uroporphyrinogen decarboxylase [Sulfidibacter corallicola]